nr:response regulator [Acidobacteriota bacterium]
AATALETLDFNRTIHDNEVRLRILVDAAPVSIVESDPSGRVQWWNRAASRLLRWPDFSGDLVEGVSWTDDLLSPLVDLWGDLLSGGLHDTREFNATVGGRARLLAVSAAVLPGNGEPRVLTLIDDVTDQRELREEVRHAHRMELRGQVASSVAHDFNNLITLIMGYAELLWRNVVGDEKSEALVNEIQATSSRASTLTAQLQSIGRTSPPAPVKVDIAATLRRNAEVLERIMGSRTSVRWALGATTPEVTVDADLFEQMILNLAINARDAMPEGGTLTLRTDVHNLADDDPRAPGATGGPHVALSIADTGTGMDAATLARCFEPLFTTKGPFKGTGLGLASARRLVEESGGVITCDSRVAGGTTFTVWLPIREPAAPTTGVDDAIDVEAPHRVPRDPTSGTVLLCEDDDALRHLALRALRRNGLTVLEAVSGEEALEILTRFDGPIDVLVSDVVLPEMKGQQLAERLQRDRPDLMIALMSGTASPEVIDGLAPGSAVFIAKPFRPSELLDHVFGLLERRTPSAS